MADVHHCPRCELRFATRSELEDHLSLDHPSTDDGAPPAGDDS